MTAYEQLLAAERNGAHTIEVVSHTGLSGVANSTSHGTIQCFIGADDGSDDKELSIDEFNSQYEITAVLGDVSEEAFDLPAYLLGEVYGPMSEEERQNWSMIHSKALAEDLTNEFGILVDPVEVYSLILEFRQQDLN